MANTGKYLVSAFHSSGVTMYVKSVDFPTLSLDWSKSIEGAKKFSTKAQASEVYEFLLAIGVKRGTRIQHIIS